MCTPPPEPYRRRFPFGLLIGAFVALDFITPIVMEAVDLSQVSTFFVALLMGALAAQFGLLAIWMVLAPPRWPVRLLVTLVLGVLFYATFLLGLMVADQRSTTWDESLLTILFVPLFFLSVQIPLWFVRITRGWRIVRPKIGETPRPESRQFGLGHLLGTGVVVALVFGLASMGVQAGRGEPAETWLGILIGFLMVCLFSGATTLPCLWAALGSRNVNRGILFVALYAPIVCTALLALVSVLVGHRPPDDEVVVLLSFFASLFATTFAVLAIARRWEYALHRVPRKRRTRPEDLLELNASDPFAPDDPLAPDADDS